MDCRNYVSRSSATKRSSLVYRSPPTSGSHTSSGLGSISVTVTRLSSHALPSRALLHSPYHLRQHAHVDRAVEVHVERLHLRRHFHEHEPRHPALLRPPPRLDEPLRLVPLAREVGLLGHHPPRLPAHHQPVYRHSRPVLTP